MLCGIARCVVKKHPARLYLSERVFSAHFDLPLINPDRFNLPLAAHRLSEGRLR